MHGTQPPLLIPNSICKKIWKCFWLNTWFVLGLSWLHFIQYLIYPFSSVYHHLPSYLVDTELNFPYSSTAWKVLCEHKILEWRCTHPPSSVLPIYISTCCFIWDISWPRAIFNQYMNSKLEIAIYLSLLFPTRSIL